MGVFHTASKWQSWDVTLICLTAKLHSAEHLLVWVFTKALLILNLSLEHLGLGQRQASEGWFHVMNYKKLSYPDLLRQKLFLCRVDNFIWYFCVANLEEKK